MDAAFVYGPETVFVNLLRSPGIDSQPGGIDSSESIPGHHKRLQIRALAANFNSRWDVGWIGDKDS
jgi:hypothetical protein